MSDEDFPALDPSRADRFCIHPDGIFFTQCFYCRHFSDEPKNICDAFPVQIPQAILENRHDHRLPYEGDGGVMFEVMPSPNPVGLALMQRDFAKRKLQQ